MACDTRVWRHAVRLPRIRRGKRPETIQLGKAWWLLSHGVAPNRLSRHRDRLQLQVQGCAQFLGKAPSCIDVVGHHFDVGGPRAPQELHAPGVSRDRRWPTTMRSAKPTAENRSSENSPLGTLRETPHTRTGCTVTALAVRRPAAPIDTRRARRSTAENASPNTSRTAPPRKFPFAKRPATAIA